MCTYLLTQPALFQIRNRCIKYMPISRRTPGARYKKAEKKQTDSPEITHTRTPARPPIPPS